MLPNVDIITINYNGHEYIDGYFNGLSGLDYKRDRITLWIVDNGSKDGSLDEIRLRAKQLGFALEIIENGDNIGFASANNQAIVRGSAEFVALLNNDTKVHSGWLKALVKGMSDPAVGVTEARQEPVELVKPLDAATGETAWCSFGGCLLRRKALDAVGVLDARLFMYYEDVDLCWRLWRGGWKCIYIPAALYDHYTQRRGGPSKQALYYNYRNRFLVTLRHSGFRAAIGFASHELRLLGRHLLRWEPAYCGALSKALLVQIVLCSSFLPMSSPQSKWVGRL